MCLSRSQISAVELLQLWWTLARFSGDTGNRMQWSDLLRSLESATTVPSGPAMVMPPPLRALGNHAPGGAPWLAWYLLCVAPGRSRRPLHRSFGGDARSCAVSRRASTAAQATFDGQAPTRHDQTQTRYRQKNPGEFSVVCVVRRNRYTTGVRSIWTLLAYFATDPWRGQHQRVYSPMLPHALELHTLSQ